MGRPPPPLFARVEKQRRRPGGEVGHGGRSLVGGALSGCSNREEGGEAAPAMRRAEGRAARAFARARLEDGASGTESEVAASSRRWIRGGGGGSGVALKFHLWSSSRGSTNRSWRKIGTRHASAVKSVRNQHYA